VLDSRGFARATVLGLSMGEARRWPCDTPSAWVGLVGVRHLMPWEASTELTRLLAD
jgi:hypothetical protein